MAAFQERNKAPIKIACISKCLLGDLLYFPEIPDYFPKCLFDCQVRLLQIELNRSERDILLTIDNKSFINGASADYSVLNIL